MPNKNYVKGRAKEYKIKRDFTKRGYTVLRTAGSHGFADLVAVRSDGKIKFIQCKPDNFSKTEEQKLLDQWEIFNNPRFKWTTSFEVI